MDAALLDEIRAHVAANPSLQVHSAEDTAAICRRTALVFGFDEKRIWWWEDAPRESAVYPYAGDEGWERLAALLPRSGSSLNLVVTDDDAPPWFSVAGLPEDLMRLLREQRFFEYFIVGPDYEWVVFDTHHNTLVHVQAAAVKGDS